MSDPIEILERRLQAVLDDEATTRGLHFFCQIGGYDDPLGLVTMQVSSSGTVLLSWRQNEEDVSLWTLQFTEADYHQFIRLFLTYPFWSANPTRRKREDGELNVHLRVSAQDVGTFKGVQFWNGDMEDYRVLRKLLLPMAKLIQNITRDTLTDDHLDRVMMPD